MRNYLIITSLLFSSIALGSQLEDLCQKKDGKMFKWYQCPKSRLILKMDTCEYQNDYGELEFVNGCSGPSGGHENIFFPACIQHDLCYHHEPASNGKGQKFCDERFLNQLLKICDGESRDINRCKKWARLVYRSLRLIGKPAFHCANYFGRYSD